MKSRRFRSHTSRAAMPCHRSSRKHVRAMDPILASMQNVTTSKTNRTATCTPRAAADALREATGCFRMMSSVSIPKLLSEKMARWSAMKCRSKASARSRRRPGCSKSSGGGYLHLKSTQHSPCRMSTVNCVTVSVTPSIRLEDSTNLKSCTPQRRARRAKLSNTSGKARRRETLPGCKPGTMSTGQHCHDSHCDRKKHAGTTTFTRTALWRPEARA
mmetsp:Transcript_138070/g.385171  ORF Transcript_138070/g.385171 Transcript_138070/m.385171 type:complete len:216 (-) Transcript_138070:470-1117(-)